MSEPSRLSRRRELVWALLCALLAAGVPLLARPTTEMPFNDEFSYLAMARSVARTGTYVFDGWATAAVGPQAYWGAAFIKLFGDSAFVLRCSTLVLAGVAGAGLYVLGRRAGLGTALAAQGSVVCMLSPLALPWSASFMTDVPGFCLAVVSLLAGTWAVTGRSAGGRTAAFGGLLLAGYCGGWMRQVVWLAVLLLPPIILLLRREHRVVRVGLYLLFACLTAGTVRLIDRQPYNISDPLLPTLLAPVQQPLATLHTVISLGHTAVFALWPVLAALLVPLARRLTPRLMMLILGLAACGYLVMPPITPSGDSRYPFYGNSITPYGLLDITIMPGWVEPSIPLWALKAVAAVNWVLIASALVAGIRAGGVRPAIGILRGRPALFLLAVFAGGVLLLSVARAVATVGFDRYLIPILPLMVIALQLARQRREASAAPLPIWGAALTWAGVALWAGLSLALIDEHHRNGDARLQAIARLTAMGIPRHEISAGFEYDGQTQLLEWGYINHPRLRSPAGAFFPVSRDPRWPLELFWFLPHAPAVQPQYIISRSPVPLYSDAGLPPVTYRFFFPPFQRTLRILRLENPSDRPLIPRGPPPIGKTVRSAQPITTRNQ